MLFLNILGVSYVRLTRSNQHLQQLQHNVRHRNVMSVHEQVVLCVDFIICNVIQRASLGLCLMASMCKGKHDLIGVFVHTDSDLISDSKSGCILYSGYRAFSSICTSCSVRISINSIQNYQFIFTPLDCCL